MVRLDILSGKRAGEHCFARHFPFQIGRSAASGLRLEDDGVWEQHVSLRLDRKSGFLLEVQPNVPAAVNGEFTLSAHLRNGDTITLGAVRMKFRLADARQRKLWMREWLLWLLVAAVAAAQIILVYGVLE